MVNGVQQKLIAQEAGEQAFRLYNENPNVIHVDSMSIDDLLQRIA